MSCRLVDWPCRASFHVEHCLDIHTALPIGCSLLAYVTLGYESVVAPVREGSGPLRGSESSAWVRIDADWQVEWISVCRCQSAVLPRFETLKSVTVRAQPMEASAKSSIHSATGAYQESPIDTF